MRVIAGEAGGIKLLSVPGRKTRPITDRVKAALFDILGKKVEGALFLDLFAGTGSVGIEALSRGASVATFVEKDPAVIRILQENLRRTGLESRAEIVQGDVFKFLERGTGKLYDIIYLAPPQYLGLWAKTLLLLDRTLPLKPGGLVVAQIFPKEYQDLPLEKLKIGEKRRYGSTLLCFYSF